MRRVVITGLGMVSPIGRRKKVYWESLIKGVSGISPVKSFDTSKCKCHVAAQIEKWEIEGEKEKKRRDISTQFAVVAAREAIEDAGINISRYGKNERTSLCIGIAYGGLKYVWEQYNHFRHQQLKTISVFSALAEFPSSCLAHTSLELGIKGGSLVISTADTSSTDAIGYGYQLIITNNADIVIAGGTEAPIIPLIFYSFSTLNLLADSRKNNSLVPRPFDAQRDGFVLGEGAAMIVMEEYEQAKRRNAYIYGEVMSYATYHHKPSSLIQDENHYGLSWVIKNVLKKCYINPKDVDYISAHGIGDITIDKVEIKAIKEVFGELSYSIPISSIKGAIGHTLGASGSFQTVTNSLVLKNGIIPPTINFQYSNIDQNMDYNPNKAKKKEVEIILQNNIGFFGKNSVLLLKKVQ